MSNLLELGANQKNDKEVYWTLPLLKTHYKETNALKLPIALKFLAYSLTFLATIDDKFKRCVQYYSVQDKGLDLCQ